MGVFIFLMVRKEYGGNRMYYRFFVFYLEVIVCVRFNEMRREVNF